MFFTKNLTEEFEYLSRYDQQSAFMYCKDRVVNCVSYDKFVTDCRTVSKYFRTVPEHRVALIGEISYNWFYCFYGALMAGKDVIIIDMLLPVDELSTVLTNMNAEYVVVSDVLTDVADDIAKMGHKIALSFWSLLLPAGESVECMVDAEKPSDGKIIALTSGTTGKAKGVVLEMPAFLYNNINLSSVLNGTEGERVYSSLPMHHMYGINKSFAYLHKGLCLCLGSMRTVIKDIECFEPQYMLTVPTVVEFMEKHNGFNTSLKGIMVSGCKCEKKVQTMCSEHGVYVQNIYGSSETAGGMALNKPEDPVDVLTVIPGREILIEDDEIVIDSIGHMKEYYNNPDETSLKLRGDRIYTGDAGFIDEDGKLHISGRIKDMISMANGDKLYCEETDEILSSLPHINEAAVLYVDRKLIACVVVDKNTPEEDVKASIDLYNKNQQLIRKMSNYWRLSRPLPRNTTGKLQRNVLEQMYIKHCNKSNTGKKD